MSPHTEKVAKRPTHMVKKPPPPLRAKTLQKRLTYGGKCTTQGKNVAKKDPAWRKSSKGGKAPPPPR